MHLAVAHSDSSFMPRRSEPPMTQKRTPGLGLVCTLFRIYMQHLTLNCSDRCAVSSQVCIGGGRLGTAGPFVRGLLSGTLIEQACSAQFVRCNESGPGSLPMAQHPAHILTRAVVCCQNAYPPAGMGVYNHHTAGVLRKMVSPWPQLGGRQVACWSSL